MLDFKEFINFELLHAVLCFIMFYFGNHLEEVLWRSGMEKISQSRQYRTRWMSGLTYGWQFHTFHLNKQLRLRMDYRIYNGAIRCHNSASEQNNRARATDLENKENNVNSKICRK